MTDTRMTKNNASKKDTKEFQEELNGLLQELKLVASKNDQYVMRSREKTKQIEQRVDKTINETEGYYRELDQTEEDASEEMDTLILEQIKYLSKES